jgi:single-strand DNA-binding protein
MSIARAVLAGQLEQDPEQRFTPQNVAVTTVWLSVPGRPGANGQPVAPMRVKLTCWRAMAEQAATLKKDQVVMVEGKLMLQSYQDQAGVQRKYFDVDVNSLSVVPGGLPQAMVPVAGAAMAKPASAAVGAAANTAAYASSPVGSSPTQADTDLYTVDEDIPF